MRNRTIARELAIKALYQLDLFGNDIISDMDTFCKENTENWELRRMAIIDKNILRLGVYELLHRNDIPPKVSINEAIELAKKYSTKNSGTFVNGILDKIYTQYGNGKLLKDTKSISIQQVIPEIDYGKSDLHVHTNYSDGTMTPEAVVDEAIRLGISTISITDHDTVDGVVA